MPQHHARSLSSERGALQPERPPLTFNSVLSLLHDILAEVHQDLRHFRAGGVAGGVEDAVALTVEQAGIHSPGHALQRPVGDILVVCEVLHIRAALSGVVALTL